MNRKKILALRKSYLVAKGEYEDHACWRSEDEREYWNGKAELAADVVNDLETVLCPTVIGVWVIDDQIEVYVPKFDLRLKFGKWFVHRVELDPDSYDEEWDDYKEIVVL